MRALLRGLALLLSLLSPAFGNAAQVEVGTGISKAQTNGDGTWYQNAFPHSISLRSPVFLLGITGKLSPHLRWHLDAVDLGSYRVNSWDTPNDANYNPGRGYKGNPLPLTNYIGSGHVWGIAPTLEIHTRGNWQVGADIGPFLYHATWNMSVPNWYPSTQTSRGAFEPSGPMQPVYFSQSHWAIGGVIGVSLHYEAWFLTIQRYLDGKGFSGHGNDGWPPLWKSQTVVMIGYQF